MNYREDVNKLLERTSRSAKRYETKTETIREVIKWKNYVLKR